MSVKEILEENLNPWAGEQYKEGIDFLNREWNEIGKKFFRLFLARACVSSFIDKDLAMYDCVTLLADEYQKELTRSEENSDL